MIKRKVAQFILVILSLTSSPITAHDVIGANVIKKPDKTAENRTEQIKEQNTVGYYGQIEPIIIKKCQYCHNPNGVAPFSLMAYEDARLWSTRILSVIKNKKMPPWPIIGGVDFMEEKKLTTEEIVTIEKWVNQGGYKGEINKKEDAITYHSQEEWSDERPPDIVMTLPKPFYLAPKGKDLYQTFVIPFENNQELYVKKVQFIPGNKKITHHNLLFYDGTGLMLDAQNRLGKKTFINSDSEDYGYGYNSGMGLGFIPNPTKIKRNKENPTGSLGGWAPGVEGTLIYPDESARIVPQKSDLIIQMHYVRTGEKEIDDASRVGLWLVKEKPKRFVAAYLLDTNFIKIPKGDSNFKSSGSVEISEDGDLFQIIPHMHMLGRAMKIWYRADEASEKKLLLDLNDWDFDWQYRYTLKEQFRLRKGSQLLIESVHDNSANNPNNPHRPPVDTFLGESTDDEMAFAIIGVVQDTQPKKQDHFIRYLTKLIEANTLRSINK